MIVLKQFLEFWLEPLSTAETCSHPKNKWPPTLSVPHLVCIYIQFRVGELEIIQYWCFPRSADTDLVGHLDLPTQSSCTLNFTDCDIMSPAWMRNENGRACCSMSLLYPPPMHSRNQLTDVNIPGSCLTNLRFCCSRKKILIHLYVNYIFLVVS